MGKNVKPGETTDLRGYAIRINKGQVYYFNYDGILTSCSVLDAELMGLRGIIRRSRTAPLTLQRGFMVSGMVNKNAFKSAAAKMHVGSSLSTFYNEAYKECVRQSSKPHKAPAPTSSKKLILEVLNPEVSEKAKFTKVTVRIIINPDYNGGKSVETVLSKMDDFLQLSKKQLKKVTRFKSTPEECLPDVSAIKVLKNSVTVEYEF